MTRQALMTAVVLAALGSPLAAADQSVEKARRYRVMSKQFIAPVPGLPEAVSPRRRRGRRASELGSLAQVAELGRRGGSSACWRARASLPDPPRRTGPERAHGLAAPTAPTAHPLIELRPAS
jgi:hypothetical protein